MLLLDAVTNLSVGQEGTKVSAADEVQAILISFGVPKMASTTMGSGAVAVIVLFV